MNTRSITIRQRGRKVALFTRQLCVMLNAAVPLTRALEILHEQQDDRILGEALADVCDRVQSGHRFSQSLAAYPRIFSPFFCGLISVGENTGSLVASMDHLASILEREDALNQKVRGALIYPACIVGLMTVLTVTLFRTVIPQFATFFRDFGVDLPFPTRLVMTITAVMNSKWSWFFGVLSVLGIARLIREGWARPQYRIWMYEVLLAIPLLGPVLKTSGLTRYCWAMQMTLSRGMNLLRSMELAAVASNCPRLRADLPGALENIREGEPLSAHMRACPRIYPVFLTQMANLAEEASDYGIAFGRSADWFEQEVDSHIELFQAALEPMLLTVVAVLVGGVVLSIFLPLYGILDKLGM